MASKQLRPRHPRHHATLQQPCVVGSLVDLDRGHACDVGGRQTCQNASVPVTSRQTVEDFSVQGVEGHVDPVEAGTAKRLGQGFEADGVGGAGDLRAGLRVPRCPTMMLTSRTTASSVSTDSDGGHARPSAGTR
ncbi:MAG: hypothetical protein HOZ81_16320 [Streptomyces sp.]|nr:hypothetical protein [Streptomyces sp.]NUS14275.1 hypothetical protein [Streptomyces sp.]NUS80374.1 hypothetical protein [Streptomyces sp.]